MCVASPISHQTCVTKSYDHTVKLWDVRLTNSKLVMEVKHGRTVESVVFFFLGGHMESW